MKQTLEEQLDAVDLDEDVEFPKERPYAYYVLSTVLDDFARGASGVVHRATRLPLKALRSAVYGSLPAETQEKLERKLKDYHPTHATALNSLLMAPLYYWTAFGITRPYWDIPLGDVPAWAWGASVVGVVGLLCCSVRILAASFGDPAGDPLVSAGAALYRAGRTHWDAARGTVEEYAADVRDRARSRMSGKDPRRKR